MCARYLRLYGFLVVHYKIPVNGMHKTARALTNSRASPLAWAINIKAVATRAGQASARQASGFAMAARGGMCLEYDRKQRGQRSGNVQRGVWIMGVH